MGLKHLVRKTQPEAKTSKIDEELREIIEKKLTSKMTDFPDLIQMIKKALKNR